MFSRRSPAVPILVTVALVVAGMGGIAAVSRSMKGATPISYEGNARRFLDLTQADKAPNASATKSGNAAVALKVNLSKECPLAGGGNCTPAGWRIRPAGRQVPVFNFPLGLSTTADQSTVLVSSDNGGMQGITQVNPSTLAAKHYPAANLFMGLTPTPGGTVYASGGNADRVFRYKFVGGVLVPLDLTEAGTFPVHHALDKVLTTVPGAPDTLPLTDGIRVTGYPGNSLLHGRYLLVAGTLAEPTGAAADACPGGQPACGRISVIDTTNDTVVARVPVGLDAYGLALDAGRSRLYVSNWADEAGRGTATGGTVSVVDLSAADPAQWHEISSTGVGHHPTAVQLSKDGGRLFVANTNDDSITVLDVSAAAPAVVSTESVRPVAGVPVGAYPNAFALSPDGDTLFVALAGMNAVEVLDGHTGARLAGHPMYIPTGWYPSALLVTGTASNYKLWVANAKGAGTATKSTGYNVSVGQELPPLDGTLSVIELPAPTAQATTWTNEVLDNDKLARVNVNPCAPGDGIRVSEVLCPPAGKESPVKHVIYMVTENKTFDQYFGDMGKGYDANPAYLLYGNVVTPNHHALAKRFSLSDRFFSDAQVSVTGHSWTSGATATDHNEKTWPADYDEGIRGNHGNGDALRPNIDGAPGSSISGAEDELDDPEGGYIFEAFKRAGAVPPAQAGPGKLSMGIYGESTARESGDMNAYKAPGWKDGDIQYFDTCRAHQFISGVAPNGPFPDNQAQVGDCSGRTLAAPFNLAHWTDVYKTTGKDVMPNFIYMSLPVNHTLGTNLGNPTPASMVADNDYAIGLITEALSKSPFWESTVVMQTEDDTQAAGDHVSPLRDYLAVSGPWAEPAANHQWGSMPSLLRSIEQLFGVGPITLFDKLAFPQHSAFRAHLTDTPDTAPYTAIKPLVPFAVNQVGAPGQAESMAMDWRTWDLIDMGTLNAILYAEARGTEFVAPAR
jgi:DNA-binding beta-propeller fold protein YncE